MFIHQIVYLLFPRKWSIIQDFDGVDIPDISNVKTEYEQVYAEYFRVTADDMPPDPVVEEQKAKELKIKKVKICPWAETYCKSGASGGGGGPDQTRKKWRTPSLLT